MTEQSEIPEKKAPSRDYRDLVVWQEGIALTKAVYLLVERLPRNEVHALSDPLRRAAISIPSNIAEGQGRKNAGDFGRFLRIALGSLAELDPQLVLTKELGYVREEELAPLQDQIVQLRTKIFALLRTLPLPRRARRPVALENPEARRLPLTLYR